MFEKAGKESVTDLQQAALGWLDRAKEVISELRDESEIEVEIKITFKRKEKPQP